MTGATVEIVGGTVVARFRDYAELVDAWRAAKEMTGASNETLEDIGDMVSGQIDKYIGPSRVKSVGPFMFNMLTELLAVEFEMRFNVEALRRMQPRWDKRDKAKVHVSAKRLSKAVIKQATPMIFSEMGKRGAVARMTKMKPSSRRRVARLAARARWKGTRPKVNGAKLSSACATT